MSNRPANVFERGALRSALYLGSKYLGARDLYRAGGHIVSPGVNSAEKEVNVLLQKENNMPALKKYRSLSTGDISKGVVARRATSLSLSRSRSRGRSMKRKIKFPRSPLRLPRPRKMLRFNTKGFGVGKVKRGKRVKHDFYAKHGSVCAGIVSNQ